jgi:hypothetical protein
MVMGDDWGTKGLYPNSPHLLVSGDCAKVVMGLYIYHFPMVIWKLSKKMEAYHHYYYYCLFIYFCFELTLPSILMERVLIELNR